MTSERMNEIGRFIAAADTRSDAARALGFKDAKSLSNVVQRDPELKAVVLAHLDRAGKPFGRRDAREESRRQAWAIDWATVNSALADLRRIRAGGAL